MALIAAWYLFYFILAYVAVREKGDLKVIIIATGSEVQLAVNAAAQIGDGVRVVSMPCASRFDRQIWRSSR